MQEIKIEKPKISFNKEALRSLIEKHSVTINVFGRSPFTEKAIRASQFMEELHECADVDKETLIEYSKDFSSGNYQKKFSSSLGMNLILESIEFPGTFSVQGHENLNNDPYILHRKISSLLS